MNKDSVSACLEWAVIKLEVFRCQRHTLQVLVSLLSRCVLVCSTDSTYYYGNGVSSCSALNQNLFQRASCALDGDTAVEARSPMAATRANSGASAASPTGSACMKTDINGTAADLLLGWLNQNQKMQWCRIRSQKGKAVKPKIINRTRIKWWCS